MGRTWVLDTETKGTGANMVPLEKVQAKAEPRRRRRKAAPPRANASEARPRAHASKAAREPQTSYTPLPAGHVRKKGTGEIGRVQSVDAKAGTASVRWLKRGGTSTVPLTAISRH